MGIIWNILSLTLITSIVVAQENVRREWTSYYPCKDKKIKISYENERDNNSTISFYLNLKYTLPAHTILSVRFEYAFQRSYFSDIAVINAKLSSIYKVNLGSKKINPVFRMNLENQFLFLISLKINNFEYCKNPTRHVIGFVIPFANNATKDDQAISKCGRSAAKPVKTLYTDLNVRPGDMPWHAYVIKRSLSRKKALGTAGTLISKYYVVTVAHVLAALEMSTITDRLHVFLGRVHIYQAINENIQLKQVSRVFIHEYFDPATKVNDIAVLKLATPAEYTEFVQPACLWHVSDYDKLTKSPILGTVVTWRSRINNTGYHGLQRITMPINSESTCLGDVSFFFMRILSDSNFCAGSLDRSLNHHFEPGASFYVFVPDVPDDDSDKATGSWHLRGLKSSEEPDNDDIGISIFTDIAIYVDWIREKMREGLLS